MAQTIINARAQYTKKKNELKRWWTQLEGNENEEVTERNIVLKKALKNKIQSTLDQCSENRMALENLVPDEEERERTILPEDEELQLSVSISLQILAANIEQAEVTILENRQQADADERRRQAEADADERRQEAEDKRRELEHHRIVEKRQIDLEIVSKELQIQTRRDELQRERPAEVVNHGHLPKISLVRFGGDSLSFSEFWDNFQSLIDGRTDLDDGQKFHYLKGQLFGKASDRIAGIRVCGENYRLAVDLLKEEFGSKDLILTTLYQEIAHLNPYRLKLDELVKLHGSSITIDHIRLQLSNELTRARVLRSLNPYESKTSSYASQPSLPRYPNRNNDRMYTTELLLRPESESIPIPVIACVFCEGKHYSDSCKKYASLDERKQSMNDEEGENAFDVEVNKSVALEPNSSASREPNSTKISVKPTAKSRKYNSDYLEMGFTFTGPEQQPKPQCVICYESLSNECMKPAKLRRHLETKHPEYKNMANNIEDTLMVRLSKSDMFAIQLDESTDISKKAIMLVFVRYLLEDQIFEDFLFSCELLQTRAEDIFTALNDFFNKHDITWTKCVGLSTDGAKSMAGHKTGLQARVKAVAPEVKWTHCCIHREALVAKTLPEPLQKILNEVVEIVNYIKTRPLQSRLFSLLCKEIGSEHEQLLIHTEVRWLSRGRILTRFVELRDELRVFLLDTKYADVLTDFSWLCSTAYLADMFEHLNVLNLSLQGKNVDMFKVEDKISAMVKKCQLWAARIENESFTNFPNLKQFLESTEESLPDPIKINAAEHLRSLATTFRIYFPEPDPDDSWIRNPFNCQAIEQIHGLTEEEQDKLVDLSSCEGISYISPFNTMMLGSLSIVDYALLVVYKKVEIVSLVDYALLVVYKKVEIVSLVDYALLVVYKKVEIVSLVDYALLVVYKKVEIVSLVDYALLVVYKKVEIVSLVDYALLVVYKKVEIVSLVDYALLVVYKKVEIVSLVDYALLVVYKKVEIVSLVDYARLVVYKKVEIVSLVDYALLV
ncbi:hypothetical protein WDU94_012212 [Cyamophila willieti]